MDVLTTDIPPNEIEADAVVVGLYADHKPEGAAALVDQATHGLLSKLLEVEEISTAACRVTPLLAPPGLVAGQVVCLGLGDREELDPGVAFHAAAAAARLLAGKKRTSVAFYGDPGWPQAISESAVAGAVVGCQGQDLYRQEKKRHEFEKLFWSSEASINSGELIGQSVNMTRRLVNEPPGTLYPESFAAAARDVAEQLGVEIEVWGRERLEEERCGALLAVAQGSAREPQLVILRYRGTDDANAPTLGLVGKGVTFDSGGLSLKPSDSMKTMKSDMAGAATVLGAVRAIAALNLPVNVNGYMGLVENMTGPAAYKLGDVLTARNGTTIEVHNTDAEGRLVLADTLSIAVEDGVSRLIDLATLTGACVVALGENVAGVMTNDQAWCEQVLDAAEAAGEPVWQLPMFEEYDEQIRSKIADIKNTGEGRWGGAMTAAKLLERFVEDVPWTHIDIAGPAFAEKPLDWLDGGGTGCLARTLIEVARTWPDGKPQE